MTQSIPPAPPSTTPRSLTKVYLVFTHKGRGRSDLLQALLPRGEPPLPVLWTAGQPAQAGLRPRRQLHGYASMIFATMMMIVSRLLLSILGFHQSFRGLLLQLTSSSDLSSSDRLLDAQILNAALKVCCVFEQALTGTAHPSKAPTASQTTPPRRPNTPPSARGTRSRM